ncbi:hypothetical protein LINPERPRIM_LOCUS37828, partial [Linum perenne]
SLVANQSDSLNVNRTQLNTSQGGQCGLLPVLSFNQHNQLLNTTTDRRTHHTAHSHPPIQ